MIEIEDLLRFNAYVGSKPEIGCWEWDGNKNDNGYGLFRAKGFNNRATRWIEAFLEGPIPKGIIVRHKCDNPTCIRPSHLERGTKADNTADVKTRGRLRAPTGADNGRAKMTVVEVTEARHQHAMGVSGHQLARTFGLAASAMNSMLRGATWKHAA